MAHIHASKTAYVAIADHRDADGSFKAGDIVIIDEPALVGILVREGSIDPSITVDASMYTPGVPTAVTPPVAPADLLGDVEGDDETDAIATVDDVTAPVNTGHRPSAHRMQTARRGKAR